MEPNIHRIPAGQSFTRTFAGSEFQATRADCGTGDLGPACFAAGQPLESGNFLLQLCYAESVPDEQSGNDFNGTFPTDGSVICVTQPFTYPQDTSVVVSTVAPPPCSATSQCPTGQLCQQGVCSASCLSNTVPTYGAQWTDSVQVIQDQGFFTHTNGDPDRLTGTGTVGSVLYNGTDMQLTVVGSAAEGSLAAQVEVMVPAGTPTVPFFTGETLSVLVIEADSTRSDSTAIAIRDAQGNLALAVDEGYGGALLSAADLAPVTLDPGGSAFACTLTTLCGKQVYQSMTFSSGNAQAEVEPGQTGTLEVGSTSYAATAVADYTDAVTDESHGLRREPGGGVRHRRTEPDALGPLPGPRPIGQGRVAPFLDPRRYGAARTLKSAVERSRGLVGQR